MENCRHNQEEHVNNNSMKLGKVPWNPFSEVVFPITQSNNSPFDYWGNEEKMETKIII